MKISSRLTLEDRLLRLTAHVNELTSRVIMQDADLQREQQIRMLNEHHMDVLEKQITELIHRQAVTK